MTTNTLTTRVVFPNAIRARRSLLRAFLSRSVMAAACLAGLAVPAGRAVAQSTYSWNTTSGTWNTTSANWAGAGPVWVNGTASSAVFANTATSSTVTLGGGLTAAAVAIGNGGNNANVTFRTGSLSASSFTLQGDGLNEPAISGYPSSTLTDVSLAVGGDLGIGRAQLVIGGTSVVTANRIGGAGMTGVSSADWGQLTIQDSAVVTATNGIVAATTAWGLNLNGGTLVTSGINYGPQSFAGSVVNLTFNGGLLLASQNNSDFITATGGLDFAPVIQAGGARVNTNGFDIGIGLPLTGTGGLTKFGAGTLTLTGASTYSGGTMIQTGTGVDGG